jgi:pimeloyl-ACP methyl ester carboxylesterase
VTELETDGFGPTSHVFFSQRLRLHYVDYGRSGLPLVVLVHGGRDHARSWDAVAAGLRARFHVVAPDLRGHGDSAWAIGSQYSMPDYLLDLNQLLRHLDVRPAALIGHSLGGAIVLQYAGIYPDRVARVVAIEGLGPPPSVVTEKGIEERLDEWIRTMESLAARQPRRYASIEQAEERMRDANARLSPSMARHLTLHGTVRMEDGSYSWKFDNYVRAWGPNAYDRKGVERLWSRIDCPVLLFRGRESWAENPVADGRASHFANARYVEVDGAGHWVHHDDPEIFTREVSSFLADWE